ALYRAGIKKHFLEAYLHVAVNVALAAAVAGVFDASASAVYFLLMLTGAVASIVAGARFSRFAFVAYGVVYSYLGISDVILRNTNDFTSVLAYIAVSATVVIVLLVILARRFGREA